MAELSDAGSAPPEGKRILGEPEVARSLLRIAHEVIERNRGVSDLVIMGIPSGGVPLAQRLARALTTASQAAASDTAAPAVPVGTLDITMFRDDLGRHPIRVPRPTWVPRASSSPSWWTAATGSCPSALTTWARTCRRRAPRRSSSP